MQNGYLPAAGTGALAFLCVGMCLVGLFQNLDDRLVLTYAETFSGLRGIRDTFLDRVNFTAMDNPLNVYHVTYPAQLESLEELDDLQRRGLVSNYSFAAPVSRDPSLLRQLMRDAWCSSGVYRAGELPANRTPGCQCIAEAYLDLVRSTLQGNETNLSVVTVPFDVRDRVATQAVKCWDRRQVTRSKSCGRVCTTHVVGLALFANTVLFLVCVSYVAFYSLTWNVYAIKAFVILIGGGLSAAFLVRDADANILSVAGVAVSLFYLTISLHEELDRDADNTGGPHPLTTTLLVNLPLIISAHTIQIGVAGYGRDLWAFGCFGVVGGLLGFVLQV